MITKFLTHMRTAGWRVEPNKDRGLPEPVKSRYCNCPRSWRDFIAAAGSLTSGDEQTWFLCADDYSPQGDSAFRWNEWELLSLETAGDDPAWRQEIIRFWDKHLPILLSVKGGYSYYAISMEDGSIVCGREPEFEECSPAAPSFGAFMEGIVNGQIEL